MPLGLPKPSTRAFWREGKKTPGFGVMEFLHGYFYAKYPYFYISTATGRHPLAKMLQPLGRVFGLGSEDDQQARGRHFAETYHGKAVPPGEARRLIEVNQEIHVDVEQVLPYDRARELLLQPDQRIVLLDCPCRVSMENPCQPIDVCLIIGDPIASFIAEHHPTRSREISVGEALDVLAAEHKRGHVHHAFFKDAMLGRFYAICNCCSCCCGAMWAHRNGIPMLASSGYVACFDPELCKGCGRCARKCPFDALSMEDKQVRLDASRCMGCGVCVGQCPEDAIQLVLDESLPPPLELKH